MLKTTGTLLTGAVRTSVFRAGVLTALALIAFAMNSVLCRMALGSRSIDAPAFAAIRVSSGAALLLLLVWARRRPGATRPRGTWLSATMLALYALAFALAYLSLSAGTGALILFAAVQATMIGHGVWSGERLSTVRWLGIAMALAGLVTLVLPGITAPSPVASILMAVAGAAWGVYSLLGRGNSDPLAATAGNFLRAAPFVMVADILSLAHQHATFAGVLLAVASGTVASGLGYVLWYAALRHLTATRAATVQLLVPVLAALGGVLFLAEPISLRLVLASVMILAGVRLSLALTRSSAQTEISPPDVGP